MAIKSEAAAPTQRQPVSFPKLMVNDTGKVVLFWASRTGMVVNSGNSVDPVGSYSGNWIMSTFRDCDAKVTLENV